MEIYFKNELTREPPKLHGIDSKLFLLTLKWMWIQEDLNYKLDWREVDSPEPYVLETKRGGRIKKGAGKAKFFAALVLLRSGYFTLEEVKKIIPPFGLILASFRAIYGEKRMKKRMQEIFFQR